MPFTALCAAVYQVRWYVDSGQLLSAPQREVLAVPDQPDLPELRAMVLVVVPDVLVAAVGAVKDLLQNV